MPAKKRSPKRKSPKRRASPKRKSPKRRASPKRKSPKRRASPKKKTTRRQKSTDKIHTPFGVYTRQEFQRLPAEKKQQMAIIMEIMSRKK